ncbi:hypothetical protein IWZ01DRAFT_537898 [Phyllosticta capitalensis]
MPLTLTLAIIFPQATSMLHIIIIRKCVDQARATMPSQHEFSRTGKWQVRKIDESRQEKEAQAH